MCDDYGLLPYVWAASQAVAHNSRTMCLVIPQVAVIVNEMAEVNIDAELVKGDGSHNAGRPDQLVELTNGCICCTLRDDLIQVRLCSLDALFCICPRTAVYMCTNAGSCGASC